MSLPVDLAPENKTVLYAPTYNPGLSSIPLLKDRMAEMIWGQRGDINIITKPHHMIIENNPAWFKWFRECDRKYENFHLIEDPAISISQLLLAADTLVSDSSSCIFQFLALNRPIVLINNLDPELAGDGYDPNSLEWTWRDVGEDISDVSDLSDAVSRGLDNPELGSEVREEYRRTLFGNMTDGRAAERIAEHIAALAEK